jgi:hypothetical protein
MTCVLSMRGSQRNGRLALANIYLNGKPYNSLECMRARRACLVPKLHLARSTVSPPHRNAALYDISAGQGFAI